MSVNNLNQNKTKYFSEEELRKNLWNFINQQATRLADNVAVKTKSSSITFGQLHQNANHIANTLFKLSDKKQVGIGLLLNDTVKIASSIIGTLKSNNYFVSLDPIFPELRLLYMIKDAGIEILITDSEHYQKAVKMADKYQKIINIDLFSSQVPTPNFEIEYSLNDLVQITYTSGSTGLPKGVVKDYRFLIRILYQKFHSENISENDRLGLTRSFNFPMPSNTVIASLLSGAGLFHYYIGKEGLIGFAEWLNNENITMLSTSPTLFRKFISGINSNTHFPAIRRVTLSGEPVLKQDAIAFQQHFSKHSELAVIYGATEIGYAARRIFPHSWDFKNEVLSCGFPYDKVEILICDDSLNELPGETEGEIVIRSEVISKGYKNNSKMNNLKFIKNETQYLYRTGDLGMILPDGQLKHLGRLDKQIKISGIRIELDSVENHLLSYPGVKEAVVHPYQDKKNNTKMAGYLVMQEEANLSPNDLRQYLSRRIPMQMVPAVFLTLETLPQTQSGKVDRKALPIPDAHRPPLENPYHPAVNTTEETLIQIWEDILGIDGIGVMDNFFELGGDSLAGVLLFLEIEQKFGIKLPLTTLLNAETIRKLGILIKKKNIDKEWFPIVPLKEEGSGTPIFFIPGFGGYPLRFRNLATRLPKQTPVFAMQARGLDGMKAPFASIEESAREYIEAIKSIRPEGPYHLGGESGGGLIVYEMAQQLLADGEKVPVLILFDSYGPGQKRIIQHYQATQKEIKYFFMLAKKHFNIITKANWSGKKWYFKYYSNWLKIQIKKKTIQLIARLNHPKMRSNLPAELKMVCELITKNRPF
ncbi:MAG: non-ribosomal peptide synthetase [Anaerolineaceae bacterium]|nr:non-ribosomal peptide synthetase [Anaerolineaceae bacterium]